MQKKGGLSWGLFILLSLVWGSSFILMKRGAENLNGWQIGAIRMLSAGLVFVGPAIWHLRSIPRNKLFIVLLSGWLGNLFPAFLFAIALEKEVNSSLAGILNSLTPLFVVAVAAIFFGVKIAKRKIFGVLIGLAGLVMLSLARGPLQVREVGFMGLIFLATFFYGLNINVVANYLKGIRPMQIASVSVAALVVPAAAVLAWQQQAHPIAWQEAQLSVWMIVLLGVIGSALATALFYVLIERAGGLFASLVTYAIPIVAVMWGLWAGEEIGPVQVSALGVILAGVYMANK